MRALTTAILFATTLLSGAAATASGADLTATQPTLQQMTDMEGIYALSDGHRARIVIVDNRLYLDIGRHYRELEPAGLDTWATRDRSLSMQFRSDQGGRQIVLNYRGALPDAAPIRLAAREQRGRGAID